MTGDRVTAEALTGDYWWGNVRRPVQFVLGMGITAVVEIGPHPVLATAIDEVADSRAVATLSSLRRDQSQRRQLLETLGSPPVRGIGTGSMSGRWSSPAP